MALAYLWHHFVKSNPESLGEAHFHAFIVDHRARPESTEEASSVATRLEGLLGIPIDSKYVMPFNEKQVQSQQYCLWNGQSNQKPQEPRISNLLPVLCATRPLVERVVILTSGRYSWLTTKTTTPRQHWYDSPRAI